MPSIPIDSDAALMMRYHYENDNAAFNALYERYRRELYTYLYRKCSNNNLADDIFQSTWYRVIDSKASIAGIAEHGVLNFAAYLFTIARNLCIDHLRAKASHEDSLDTLLEDDFLQIADDSAKQPLAQLELKELIDLFSTAINQLSPKQREAFILRRLKELSLEEIAKIQGITREGVRTRLRAVMRKLRPILDQWRAS